MKFNKEAIRILLFLLIGISLVKMSYEEKPESLLITYKTKIATNDNGDQIIDQRYKVGENNNCIYDCKSYSENSDLLYHSAMVRSFGECNCRYLE
ncbi:MAG: hypothetical protein VW079_01850 [Candidatus Woesearchaeota archaeon]